MAVIVIAFDGMDYELIQEFDLENVVLDEFGTIDNDTGVYKRKTSELFTSFITGETYEKHGVKSFQKKEYGNKYLEKFDRSLSRTKLGKKTNSLRNAIYTSINRIDYTRRAWKKEDYEIETIFEKVDAAKPLFVPGYNPQFEWSCEMPRRGLLYGYSKEKIIEKAIEYSERRIEKFWSLSFPFWDLVMLQLHDPDMLHHLKIGGREDFEVEDFKSDYERLDRFAGEVVERFSEDHTLIFMSDHGLPEGLHHNTNAFYSSNRDLFANEEPHITDFHDKIIEIARGG